MPVHSWHQLFRENACWVQTPSVMAFRQANTLRLSLIWLLLRPQTENLKSPSENNSRFLRDGFSKPMEHPLPTPLRSLPEDRYFRLAVIATMAAIKAMPWAAR